MKQARLIKLLVGRYSVIKKMLRDIFLYFKAKNTYSQFVSAFSFFNIGKKRL